MSEAINQRLLSALKFVESIHRQNMIHEGEPSTVLQEIQVAIAFAEGTPHPDEIAVDQFARAMKIKLSLARSKGREGWDDPARFPVEYLAQLLVEHVDKGDPVDVANFCMMLHQRFAPKEVLAHVAQREYRRKKNNDLP
jgi:hypothetical protein